MSSSGGPWPPVTPARPAPPSLISGAGSSANSPVVVYPRPMPGRSAALIRRCAVRVSPRSDLHGNPLVGRLRRYAHQIPAHAGPIGGKSERREDMRPERSLGMRNLDRDIEQRLEALAYEELFLLAADEN